jgi:hypothetical protein
MKLMDRIDERKHTEHEPQASGLGEPFIPQECFELFVIAQTGLHQPPIPLT